MMEQQEGTRRILDALDLTPPPPEPEHDGDYWRGALKVCAERDVRIRRELLELEERRAELERLGRITRRMRDEAIIASRNLLPRTEVASLLHVQPALVAAAIKAGLRKRGMGVR